MRKLLSVLMLITVMVLVGCSKFPDGYPLMNVIYDGKSFETTVNGATWINSSNGGSSADLGDWDIEVAKDIKPILVKAESVLELKLSQTKDISSFKVMLVEGSNKDSQKLTEINTKQYKFTAPKQKGEYIYSVKAGWDEKHGVGYVFKITVD